MPTMNVTGMFDITILNRLLKKTLIPNFKIDEEIRMCKNKSIGKN